MPLQFIYISNVPLVYALISGCFNWVELIALFGISLDPNNLLVFVGIHCESEQENVRLIEAIEQLKCKCPV